MNEPLRQEHKPRWGRMLGHNATILISSVVCCFLFGCSWFRSFPVPENSMEVRPRVAILPIEIKSDITHLSTVETLEGELAPEQERQRLSEALRVVGEEARWQLQSRLATRHAFRFVPSEEVDAAILKIGLMPGSYPMPEQVTALGMLLEADLVIFATIEDYGKVRWQWLLAGMLTDMTVDNFIIGLATAWNPLALSASVGWDLLTSAPVWFGGGYLFGVAFRPVRVEARTYETTQGYPTWQTMEVAMYAWRELGQLSEADQKKKQYQLLINLHNAIETLADSLAREYKTAEINAEREGAPQEKPVGPPLVTRHPQR